MSIVLAIVIGLIAFLAGVGLAYSLLENRLNVQEQRHRARTRREMEDVERISADRMQKRIDALKSQYETQIQQLTHQLESAKLEATQAAVLPSPIIEPEPVEPEPTEPEPSLTEAIEEPTEPEAIEEPIAAEPIATIPVEPEPVELEPTEPEPSLTEAIEESTESEAIEEPIATAPVEPEPVELEPTEPEPSLTEAIEEPIAPEPIATAPVEPEPVELEPSLTEAIEEPTESEAIEEPIAPEPIATIPVEPEPVELEPVEPEPTEPEPMEPEFSQPESAVFSAIELEPAIVPDPELTASPELDTPADQEPPTTLEFADEPTAEIPSITTIAPASQGIILEDLKTLPHSANPDTQIQLAKDLLEMLQTQPHIEIPKPLVINVLKGFSQDPVPQLRELAVLCLSQIRSPLVVPLLRQRLRDTDVAVVKAAQEALEPWRTQGKLKATKGKLSKVKLAKVKK